ncbi:MAG: GIY-YIG nuclease family protein [Candidatus Portnoybacteria bacterium]|nr:GIY-YIG nuclease family protein [Candidatus Portnoybacteria bacterium]
MKNWYVYMLYCKDSSIYTGISNNVEKRFLEHTAGKGGRYTRAHGVEKILYTEFHPSRSEALKREVEIKGWHREKKLRLMK